MNKQIVNAMVFPRNQWLCFAQDFAQVLADTIKEHNHVYLRGEESKGENAHGITHLTIDTIPATPKELPGFEGYVVFTASQWSQLFKEWHAALLPVLDERFTFISKESQRNAHEYQFNKWLYGVLFEAKSDWEERSVEQ